MKKNKKGFTLVEILVIIAIIAILVSVILVSLFSTKQKSKDVSAFTSFRSAIAPVFACLTSGGLNLTQPIADTSICNPSSVISGSVWPDFAQYGWSPSWCDVNYLGSTPPTPIATYSDGVAGGAKGSGNFCLTLTDGTKAMWCTINGCYKQGF